MTCSGSIRLERLALDDRRPEGVLERLLDGIERAVVGLAGEEERDALAAEPPVHQGRYVLAT